MNILMNDPNGSYDAMMGRAQLIRTLKEKDEQLSAAEAERDRLREALRTIANFAVGEGDVCEIIARRARAALDAGKEQP
jgi:hypothetical protein